MTKHSELTCHGVTEPKLPLLFCGKGSPKIDWPIVAPFSMDRHFRFLLGHLHVPGEIANNDYAIFGGGVGGGGGGCCFVARGVLWDLRK